MREQQQLQQQVVKIEIAGLFSMFEGNSIKKKVDQGRGKEGVCLLLLFFDGVLKNLGPLLIVWQLLSSCYICDWQYKCTQSLHQSCQFMLPAERTMNSNASNKCVCQQKNASLIYQHAYMYTHICTHRHINSILFSKMYKEM